MTNSALTTHSEFEGWILFFSISDSYKKTEQLHVLSLILSLQTFKKKKNKTARQNSESFMV